MRDVWSKEFKHGGDVFLVWRRSRSPELFRVSCGHVAGPCPFDEFDIMRGGVALPSIPRRLLSEGVLEAVARDSLGDYYPPPTPVHASALFDQEAAN